MYEVEETLQAMGYAEQLPPSASFTQSNSTMSHIDLDADVADVVLREQPAPVSSRPPLSAIPPPPSPPTPEPAVGLAVPGQSDALEQMMRLISSLNIPSNLDQSPRMTQAQAISDDTDTASSICESQEQLSIAESGRQARSLLNDVSEAGSAHDISISVKEQPKRLPTSSRLSLAQGPDPRLRNGPSKTTSGPNPQNRRPKLVPRQRTSVAIGPDKLLSKGPNASLRQGPISSLLAR